MTLGDYWADPDADTPHESFHFALNNTVTRDSRIPPWKMDATKAANRNVSVDARYGPDVGNYYRNYDTINLYRAGAATATIDLLYEPTSWEYVQFLYLANQRANAFLAEEGANMLEAWLWAVDNGLAEPFVLASAAWPAGLQTCPIAAPSLENPVADDKAVLLSWSASTGATSYRLYYDQADKAQLVAALNCSDGPCTDYTDSGLTNGQEYCYKVTASDGDCESDFSGILCATPQNPGQAATDEAGARFDDLHPIGIYETTKGKNATAVWSDTETFNAGDEVIMNLNVENSAGSALAGATVTVTISGPENTTLTSTTSGGDGAVEVRWSTQAPNRKSTGGTAAGSYIATVMGVSANGYSWDGSRATLTFTVN